MSYGSRQPDVRSKAVSPKRSLTDIRSTAVSPDRWRDPGLLFRRDSESSTASSYHSTPTNGSPQIRSTLFEPFNHVLSPYPESSTASSALLFSLPEVPDTPVSTLGQFGDLVEHKFPQNPSATELVQKVHQSWRNQSRNVQSGTQQNQSHSRTRSRRLHSQSRSRSEQRQGREGQDLRNVLGSPESHERSFSGGNEQASFHSRESRERSLGRSTTQQSSDVRGNRECSRSRSTLQAAAFEPTREARERSYNRTAAHAPLDEIKRTREKERERDRQRDRSASTHRRGASSKELHLVAHVRSYDNDRDIAADKISRFLESLEPSTQAFMTLQTPQSNPLPSIARFAASETSQPAVSQQTPVSSRPQTPQSLASHTTQSTPTQHQTPNPDKELMLENRGLYQRVAALQRTERDLLAENQDLARQLAILTKQHETRRQQWQDEFQGIREREKILLCEAQQLKAQVMRQEEQIINLTCTNNNSQLAPTPKATPGLLSDEEISAWFAERDGTWYTWARDYASRDPNRLSTGLHPHQLHELCDGVKDFVNVRDGHNLPSELLVGSIEMVQTLLHGILANFICTEALSSPFWVFNAISSGTPESPYVAPLTAISPGGLRFDHAMLNAIPFRNDYVPSAQIARMPLSLLTTNLPSSHHHHDPIGPSTMAYPMKAEIENMFHMLTKAQGEDRTPSTSPAHVQASLFHLFATAGISLTSASSSSSANGTEAKRMLIESRLNYARRLKDRFLSGVARFLLQDQDPVGIAKLERSLTEHIDDALRFSCQLWARPGPIRLHGLAALGGQVYKEGGGKLMELCRAQQQQQQQQRYDPNEVARQGQGQGQGPPEYHHDGKPVVMVIQPAIESLGKINSAAGEDNNTTEKPSSKTSKVWLKARVLVTTATATAPPQDKVPAPTACAQGQGQSPHARSNADFGSTTAQKTGPASAAFGIV
ncbi:hypothetical protein QBC32DRAFT_375580 [Pseudoneurospora amorphoporcata]|uniref:Uncharacterized protein n=1 Tax=Pseudoneurospora amorphoporcata TaxID=241081 RepID=A0AAN6NTD1_9PEZI|nr:hypothetical protein QBC32DRAFT_375580 [Pseudoneurospora amorphoporcata]